jgi:hypothetical protein
MRIDFRALPGPNSVIPRPIVDVFVEGLPRAALGCLVDTGTLHNRFDAGVAREAGISLDVPQETIGLGGRWITTWTVEVTLRLGDVTWEAPVSFCQPWAADFQLLGQEGFLRWFRLTCEVANRWLELDPQE